ncbi:unnamed protein product [Periconia digitata]|uniref:Uncharacterized protein n=1 Tax=Periconia digitata TaxID=1303443 RepID=A0A9W4UL68_9PLEO|nr:unnamed protein product [Periconia digitata]
MSAPLRPLLPAISGAHTRHQPAPEEKQRKRQRVSNACEACRLHKLKVGMPSIYYF